MATPSVAEEFDRRAAGYDSERWYHAQATVVLERLSDLDAGSLLDVGCGTGHLLRRFARARPGRRATGIELSREMLAAGARRALEEGASVELVLADWERAPTSMIEDPLGRTRFDAAACVSALHYFDDPVEACRRIRDLLRPGGTLLVLDRDRDASPVTRAWDFVHRRVLRDHVRFHSAGELCTVLARAGFDEPRVMTRIRRWAWQGKLHSALVLCEARRPPVVE